MKCVVEDKTSTLLILYINFALYHSSVYGTPFSFIFFLRDKYTSFTDFIVEGKLAICMLVCKHGKNTQGAQIIFVDWLKEGYPRTFTLLFTFLIHLNNLIFSPLKSDFFLNFWVCWPCWPSRLGSCWIMDLSWNGKNVILKEDFRNL